MDMIQFHINWKNYARNRLLELLKRAGPVTIQQSFEIGGKSYSAIKLVADLDHSLCSFFNSIEKHAFATSPDKQRFSSEMLTRLDASTELNTFFSELHSHFLEIIGFIATLSPDDLMCPVEAPGFKSSLDVGWIIQYTLLYEQAITSRITAMFQQYGIEFTLPWATSSFMKPVKQLVFPG